MATPPRPVPRSIVVCEDVIPDPDRPTSVTLVRVLTNIRPKAGAGYPAVQASLVVFAQLTECRGAGRLRMEIRSADTDAVAYRSPDRPFAVPNEPLAVQGVTFRVLGCVFPAPGVYWVQLRYNDEVLTQTPLTLRPARPDTGG